MQFDKDMNSSCAKLFLDIREELIKNIKEKDEDEIFEKYSANITTYYSKNYEGGFCYVKTKKFYVHIAWFFGSKLEDKTDVLTGEGKNIRAHCIFKLDKKTKLQIKDFIQQSKIFMLEKKEQKQIKKFLK